MVMPRARAPCLWHFQSEYRPSGPRRTARPCAAWPTALLRTSVVALNCLTGRAHRSQFPQGSDASAEIGKQNLTAKQPNASASPRSAFSRTMVRLAPFRGGGAFHLFCARGAGECRYWGHYSVNGRQSAAITAPAANLLIIRLKLTLGHYRAWATQRIIGLVYAHPVRPTGGDQRSGHLRAGTVLPRRGAYPPPSRHDRRGRYGPLRAVLGQAPRCAHGSHNTQCPIVRAGRWHRSRFACGGCPLRWSSA